MAGLTLMDTAAPSQNQQCSICERKYGKTHQKWHGFDNNRLRYCVTPRFALSCSSEMLTTVVRFQHTDLWMQTPLENKEEVQIAKIYFLVLKVIWTYTINLDCCMKSLFAHCIYVEDENGFICRERSCCLHNPDSNFSWVPAVCHF